MAKQKSKNRRPRHHLVRIVVVPDRVAGARPLAAANAGLLTEQQLQAAEEFLRAQPAHGANVNAASAANAESLFDVVTTTDIIVIGQQPASVRDVNGRRKVVAHSHEPNSTVLRVWTESDTIEWRCDRPFWIEKFERAGWKFRGAPSQPFYRNPCGQKKVAQREAGWSYTSSPLRSSANNQQYKATFVINGQRVDPDIMCGDPPPAP